MRLNTPRSTPMTPLERCVRWVMNKIGIKAEDIGRIRFTETQMVSSSNYTFGPQAVMVEDLYLTRWTLGRTKEGGKIFLHLFHRSDSEPYPHDHPWTYTSLILLGGYMEYGYPSRGIGIKTQEWYGPGSILRRPSTWRHRVEIPEGKVSWSLVITGPKKRQWGFWCPGIGFVPFEQHLANEKAGKPGCG